ncbi:hypothetical protein ColLi_11424 [Colletotrichum liriopes]|uniref:Uncharacterized protein n=1 Tax=Colletotrichum liriopes TaxID=708192 RepID=A0AA37LYF2_9PEZI|nr:hypothetical protein ColLi_11424 [Colletotrichum liriopes]
MDPAPRVECGLYPSPIAPTASPRCHAVFSYGQAYWFHPGACGIDTYTIDLGPLNTVRPKIFLQQQFPANLPGLTTTSLKS